MSMESAAIGAAIARLQHDYDQALVEAAGDEQIIDFYLPAGWVTLARRMMDLLVRESQKTYAAVANRLGAAEVAMRPCEACDGRLFCIIYDPESLRRQVRCAACGMVCHV